MSPHSTPLTLTPGKPFSEPSTPPTSVDSRPYRAPELLFGTRDYDPFALDLWALAATLAEFFTPFGLPEPSSPASDDSGEDKEGRWGEEDLEREFGGDKDGAFAPPSEAPVLTRQTLFEGTKGDIALVGSIFKIVGTPTVVTWPVSPPPALPPLLFFPD